MRPLISNYKVYISVYNNYARPLSDVGNLNAIL
jgi:hypothetical protein